MTENQITAKEADLKALRELKSSRGWEILMQTASKDIVSAALDMASNPTMTEKEIDFRRGAIFATNNFVNVIDLLIISVENDLYMASATLAADNGSKLVDANNFNATA
jgi:hypothetical protein